MLEDLKWCKQPRRSFQLMHNHVLAGGFNISNITTIFTQTFAKTVVKDGWNPNHL